MTNEKMNICLLSSDAFMPHSAALIASIMENKAPEDCIVFHYFCENVSDKSKATLLTMKQNWDFDIQFYDMEVGFFDGYHQFCKGSYMGYYKIVIPRILPQEIDKVLFLDSDMIVQTSLAPFYETNIEGKYAAVVAERKKCDYFCTHNEPYFNAGVVLMNLKKYREDHIEEKIIDLCNKRIIKAICVEQDFLNEVFRGNVIYLPLQWNMMLDKIQRDFLLSADWNMYPYSEDEIHEAESNPKIIHYVSNRKPWLFTSRCHDKSSYWDYARKTPFYGQIQYVYYVSWLSAFRIFPKTFLRNIIQLRSGRNGYVRIFGVTVFDFSKTAEFSRDTEPLEIPPHKRTRFHYNKYRLLSNITLGKMRKKYNAKRKAVKEVLNTQISIAKSSVPVRNR